MREYKNYKECNIGICFVDSNTLIIRRFVANGRYHCSDEEGKYDFFFN